MTEQMEETKEKKSGKPAWVKMKSEELEKLVVDLAKKGETPAKIGLILRDQHGVPKAKLIGKKISQILKDHNIKYPVDKDRVEKKIVSLTSHSSKNKHDHSASRALTTRQWDLYHIKKAAK